MIIVRVDAFEDVAVTEAVAAVWSGAVSTWDDVVVADGGWNRAVVAKVAADTSPSGMNSNITKRQSVWFILKYPSSLDEDYYDVKLLSLPSRQWPSSSTVQTLLILVYILTSHINICFILR